MNFDVHEWFTQQQEGNTLWAYKGAVTSRKITEILTETEKQLKEKGEETRIVKKLYNVLIESLQNLYHHSKVPPGDLEENFGNKFAVVILKKDEKYYIVLNGNFIEKSQTKFLRDRIEQINYLNKDERKTLYKLILNNQEYSDKGGGGLGLIDIARRTGKKINYQFYSYNNNYSFFCLEILI